MLVSLPSVVFDELHDTFSHQDRTCCICGISTVAGAPSADDAAVRSVSGWFVSSATAVRNVRETLANIVIQYVVPIFFDNDFLEAHASLAPLKMRGGSPGMRRRTTSFGDFSHLADAIIAGEASKRHVNATSSSILLTCGHRICRACARGVSEGATVVCSQCKSFEVFTTGGTAAYFSGAPPPAGTQSISRRASLVSTPQAPVLEGNGGVPLSPRQQTQAIQLPPRHKRLPRSRSDATVAEEAPSLQQRETSEELGHSYAATSASVLSSIKSLLPSSAEDVEAQQLKEMERRCIATANTGAVLPQGRRPAAPPGRCVDATNNAARRDCEVAAPTKSGNSASAIAPKHEVGDMAPDSAPYPTSTQEESHAAEKPKSSRGLESGSTSALQAEREKRRKEAAAKGRRQANMVGHQGAHEEATNSKDDERHAVAEVTPRRNAKDSHVATLQSKVVRSPFAASVAVEQSGSTQSIDMVQGRDLWSRVDGSLVPARISPTRTLNDASREVLFVDRAHESAGTALGALVAEGRENTTQPAPRATPESIADFRDVVTRSGADNDPPLHGSKRLLHASESCSMASAQQERTSWIDAQLEQAADIECVLSELQATEEFLLCAKQEEMYRLDSFFDVVVAERLATLRQQTSARIQRCVESQLRELHSIYDHLVQRRHSILSEIDEVHAEAERNVGGASSDTFSRPHPSPWEVTIPKPRRPAVRLRLHQSLLNSIVSFDELGADEEMLGSVPPSQHSSFSARAWTPAAIPRESRKASPAKSKPFRNTDKRVPEPPASNERGAQHPGVVNEFTTATPQNMSIREDFTGPTSFVAASSVHSTRGMSASRSRSVDPRAREDSQGHKRRSTSVHPERPVIGRSPTKNRSVSVDDRSVRSVSASGRLSAQAASAIQDDSRRPFTMLRPDTKHI